MLGLSTAQAAEQPTDIEISSAIDAKLMKDKAVTSNMIDVTVLDGIATLSGSVDNVLAQDRAIRLTQAIRGVRSVVNEITISAPLRTDSEIRADVEDALLFDAATESYEIDVSVSNQSVTLTGTVESWQEKELAAKVAKGVRGVKSLDNQIEVDYQSDRSDAEIRAEIKEALRWDVLVDDAMIDVSVNDGDVTFSGTVGSAAEKREARYNAWVAGVKNVNDDKLNVAKWARDEDLRKDKYVDKSDDAIEQAVEDAMLYDPRVNSFDITASSQAGVVTLSGEVDKVQAKRAAASNARNTVGVWRVKNQIKVRPSTLADDAIEQNIANALTRDHDVNRYEIAISVINGEAYLNGTVDSYWEKAAAEDIASRASGVVEVHNNLTVDDTYGFYTYDPYVDYYDYDWYTPSYDTTFESDWEILADIRDELYWSPFVDSDEVTVNVDDGVATLTGTVDTWSERQAASENAFEGGAVAVDNDLVVIYGPEYYNGE